MAQRLRSAAAGVLLVTAMLATGQGAENAQQPGHPALSQAVQALLAAESIFELGQGAEFCRQALRRLQRPEDRQFCRQLLASALVQRAAYLLTTALDASPQSAQELQFWQKLVRLGARDAQEALELVPDAAEPYYLLGRFLLMQGKVEQARQLLQQSLRYPAADPRLQARALAVLGNLAEDPRQRRQFYDRACRLAPGDAEVRLGRARFLTRRRQWTQALADLDAAVAAEPKNLDARLLRADVLLKLRRYEKARRELQRLRKLAPGHAQVHLLLGLLATEQHRFAEAAQAFTRAIAFRGATPRLLALRAHALLRAGQQQEALRDARAAVQLETDDLHVLTLALGVLLEGQDPRAAEPLLQEALKNHPDHAPLWYLEAARQEKQGRPAAALQAVTRALQQDDSLVSARLLRARLYQQQGRWDLAAWDYEQVLRRDADNITALNNLAWILATAPQPQLRNGTRAVQLAQRACRLTRFRDAAALSTLAAALAEQGRFDEAVHWAVQALRAAPGKLQKQVAAELQSYRQRKPWRQRVVRTQSRSGGPALQRR